MAIFHFTVKIVGRSKGKSIIAASAYLNGDVMKNEETGKVSYYTSKKEVVYTSLMMCENAPPEWTNVPDENIKRFQKSIRYQRAEDKEAALEKFKIVFRKQRLWNEVLKVEKGANAQFGRSFEFSLPKEWSRMEQIEYATDFIQRNFVAKGMCADWSIHDKGDGNPHVHLLVTMRPFKKNHTWGNKEIKDWAFVRDEAGNIVIDETHPNWWQDKKTPERHGIRIPVLDADGNQKLDSRNRKQWKRGVTDATGWNNPKNCELWRSEWAKECNLHLKKEQQIDHRSYERQGKIEIPTIHEGADARKIEEKYQSGQGEQHPVDADMRTDRTDRRENVKGIDYSNKDTFNWISVIRLPDFITEKDFAWAVQTATKKKKIDCSPAEFLTIDEGLCVQIMHQGSFDSEPATVALLEDYLKEQGYENNINEQRLHHEIYMSDARKVAPEKWKTVIRHPIKKV